MQTITLGCLYFQEKREVKKITDVSTNIYWTCWEEIQWAFLPKGQFSPFYEWSLSFATGCNWPTSTRLAVVCLPASRTQTPSPQLGFFSSSMAGLQQTDLHISDSKRAAGSLTYHPEFTPKLLRRRCLMPEVVAELRLESWCQYQSGCWVLSAYTQNTQTKFSINLLLRFSGRKARQKKKVSALFLRCSLFSFCCLRVSGTNKQTWHHFLSQFLRTQRCKDEQRLEWAGWRVRCGHGPFSSGVRWERTGAICVVGCGNVTPCSAFCFDCIGKVKEWND